MSRSVLERYVAVDGDTKGKLLGAAFVVVNKDGILYSESKGRIAIDPASPAFNLDTFTRTASMTKLPTVTCVMQLVEQGKLNLDDDVRSIAPELEKLQVLRGFDGETPILENHDKPITLRMLLSHTFGLAYDTSDPDIIRWSKSTRRKVTSFSFNMEAYTIPLKFTPGEGWQYGAATDWAGIILERVTGQKLNEYMQQHIFDSTGMKDSTFHPTRLPHKTAGRAWSSVRQRDGSLADGAHVVKDIPNHEVDSGGAGLYSTAADYTKFLQSFLAGKYLNEKTMDEMFKPQLNENQRAQLQSTFDRYPSAYAPEIRVGSKVTYGLAGLINQEDVPGGRRKNSMSWSGAFNSRWWIDPQTGIAGVFFVNCFPWGDKVAAKCFEELQQVAYKKQRPSVL